MTTGAEALRHLTTPRIDTRTSQRRAVAIPSWDVLAQEVDRVERAAAPDGEGLRVTGNWSAGQILDHVARAIERSMDGFVGPHPVRPGTNGAAERKSRMLSLPLAPAGPSIACAGDIEPPVQVWTPDGAAHIRTALNRVRENHPLDKPSPMVGPLTQQEWTTFHLRHAALHLSFIVFGERN